MIDHEKYEKIAQWKQNQDAFAKANPLENNFEQALVLCHIDRKFHDLLHAMKLHALLQTSR